MIWFKRSVLDNIQGYFFTLSTDLDGVYALKVAEFGEHKLFSIEGFGLHFVVLLLFGFVWFFDDSLKSKEVGLWDRVEDVDGGLGLVHEDGQGCVWLELVVDEDIS